MNPRVPRCLCQAASLLSAFVAIGLWTPTAVALTTTESAAKTDQFLGECGHTFVKKTDTVWYLDYQGKSLEKFKLIIAVQDDLMVVFVTVVTKAQMQLTPEFTEKLLRYNSRFDRVKIGLDNDGDLFVRCDASVRIMDLQEFKAVIEQVANATDELHKGISSMLISK